jgi:hypothetical protein
MLLLLSPGQNDVTLFKVSDLMLRDLQLFQDLLIVFALVGLLLGGLGYEV